MQIRTLLALLACLALSSCTPEDPLELIRAGEKQLTKRDYDAAVSSFETALDRLADNEFALRKAALFGRAQALAALDGPFARRAFLSLAESEPLKLVDYQIFARALIESASYEDAAAVLEHAKQRFPKKAVLDRLIQEAGQLAEAASAGGDNSAMEALRGLGYVSSGAPEKDQEEN